MNDSSYKYLTAFSGLVAAVCAAYSIYLTLTMPRSFQDIALNIDVKNEASVRGAISDLEDARREVAERSIAEGIKNVAIPPRLDEPAKISVNQSERFDTRKNMTTTVAINHVNSSNFYATVGGVRQNYQVGDQVEIDDSVNCAVHFTSLDQQKGVVGAQVFCNDE